MAAVNFEAPTAEEGEAVRVGVVLPEIPEGKGRLVISDDGHTVDCSLGNSLKSFFFDRPVTADNVQRLQSELLQPLAESIPAGYNAALLICGTSIDEISGVIDRDIVKPLLSSVFAHVMSRIEEELFTSVSFLQVRPRPPLPLLTDANAFLIYQVDSSGSAVDLLNPTKGTLKAVSHPVLGGVARGLSEVCVGSADEAYSLYRTCRETMKAGAEWISSSFLFAVNAERKLRPGKEGFRVCRGRLRLFVLAGRASGIDPGGINPLVKAVGETQSRATSTDDLLSFLLSDALTGNSRTVLIYYLHPHGVGLHAGVLDDEEIPSALALARDVKNLTTKATVCHWCPRRAELELRGQIADLRNAIMSPGGDTADGIVRLAELNQNLQIVKEQSWEKRRDGSDERKVQIKLCSSPTFCAEHGGECEDAVEHGNQQLRQEMEEHIKGSGDVKKIQDALAGIRQLRDAYDEGTTKTAPVGEKSDLWQQLEFDKARDRRRRIREDHGRLMEEELEKMEKDLADGRLPTAGPRRELLVLNRERQLLVLQTETLRAEIRRAETDLQDQYRRHGSQLKRLGDETLQVFRAFHSESEELRKMSEGRYRAVLLEAVQDAIYLSAQNRQLQADNAQLRKALGELKDTLAKKGDGLTVPLSPAE